MAGVEQAMTEAARESASGFSEATVPDGLLSGLWRVRTDTVMVGRALAQPLPPVVAEILSPCAMALLEATSTELRLMARAIVAGARLDSDGVVQPRARFEEAVERMRQARLTSDMTFDAAARVYGLVFALESLLGNIVELVGLITELAEHQTAPSRGL